MLLFLAGFITFPIAVAAVLTVWHLMSPTASEVSCWSCGVISDDDLVIVRWFKSWFHFRMPAHKRKWKAWAFSERAMEAQGKQANLHALRWLEREGL